MNFFFFAFLKHQSLTFLIKLSLSQSMSMLVFLLFSPHPMGDGSEQDAVVVFGSWRMSAHHRHLST